MFDYATDDIRRANEATERFVEKVKAHLFPDDRGDSPGSDSDSDADKTSDGVTDTPFERLQGALQKKLGAITERTLDWVEAYINGSWERLRLAEEQKRTLLKESRMACECIASTCSRILNSVAAVLDEISEGIEGALTWFVSKVQGFVRNAASMLLFIFYGGKPFQPHQPAACLSPGTAFEKTSMLYKFRGREKPRVKELRTSQEPRVDQELQMEKDPRMPEAMPVTKAMPVPKEKLVSKAIPVPKPVPNAKPVSEEKPVPEEKPAPRTRPVFERVPFPDKSEWSKSLGRACSCKKERISPRRHLKDDKFPQQRLKDQNFPHLCVAILHLILTFLIYTTLQPGTNPGRTRV